MRTDLAHWARYSMIAAAWLGSLAVGACKGRTNTADTGRVETPAATDTSAMAAPADTGAATATNVTYTDPNIVALLDEANKADSSAGALAATKATSSDVKRFARLMMSEHHALRLQGQQLAKKLGVTPAAPANDPVAPMAQKETDTLGSTPKGAAFDRVYIDQEVAAHRAVKDLLAQSKESAQNEQLKDLIGKAQPVIDKHLEQAEALQKKLGGSA
jgi:putative membrane protein